MGRAQGDGAVVEDGVLVRGDIGEESVYLQFTVRRVRAVSGRAWGEKAVGGRPEVGSSAGRTNGQLQGPGLTPAEAALAEAFWSSSKVTGSKLMRHASGCAASLIMLHRR